MERECLAVPGDLPILCRVLVLCVKGPMMVPGRRVSEAGLGDQGPVGVCA